MEKLLDISFVPSLKQIAASKTAFTLWTKDGIRVLVSEHLEDENSSSRNFDVRGNAILENIRKMQIPDSTKHDIFSIIKPIGMHITDWIRTHNIEDYNDICLTFDFYMSPFGAINCQETAKNLLKNVNLNIVTRYKLACMYCLDQHVADLWHNIPQNLRDICEKDEDFGYTEPLLAMWTHEMHGPITESDLNEMVMKRLERECSPCQFAFEFAANEGNLAATKFYLQKLTLRERRESLVKTAISVSKHVDEHDNYIADIYGYPFASVLHYLLSQMDRDEQMEACQNLRDILNCFIGWPWQDFMLVIARQIWDYLSEEDCYYILYQITLKIESHGGNSHKYSKLLSELWQLCPLHFKDYTLQHINSMLTYLFLGNDLNNVRLLLSHLAQHEKREFILSNNGLELCCEIIEREDWNQLKFLVKECVVDAEEVIELKTSVATYKDMEYLGEQAQAAFACFNELVLVYRNAERAQGDDVPAKRPRFTNE